MTYDIVGGKNPDGELLSLSNSGKPEVPGEWQMSLKTYTSGGQSGVSLCKPCKLFLPEKVTSTD